MISAGIYSYNSLLHQSTILETLSRVNHPSTDFVQMNSLVFQVPRLRFVPLIINCFSIPCKITSGKEVDDDDGGTIRCCCWKRVWLMAAVKSGAICFVRARLISVKASADRWIVNSSKRYIRHRLIPSHRQRSGCCATLYAEPFSRAYAVLFVVMLKHRNMLLLGKDFQSSRSTSYPSTLSLDKVVS